jgi:hypothetical protein
MNDMYGISRKQMIKQGIGLPVIWDDGVEEWLLCSDTLIIEGLNDTHEGMGEDDGYTCRVSVTDSSKGIKERLGRIVGADYQDFMYSEGSKEDNQQ